MSALAVLAALLALAVLALLGGGFFALATGRMSLDLGWGRSIHPLGPLERTIGAPRELVYELMSAPYVGRANDATIDVIASGDGLVVAAHLTKVHFYEARTVEAVDFEPPERIGFRHLTGPVPQVREEFTLERIEAEGGEEATVLRYGGELGIDYWWLGRLAARRWVLGQWNGVVAAHMDEVGQLAERRAEGRRKR